MLGLAAFDVSWKQRSFLVAGLLSASSMIGMISGLIATGYLSIIRFQGLIMGVTFTLVIFGLCDKGHNEDKDWNSSPT